LSKKQEDASRSSSSEPKDLELLVSGYITPDPWLVEEEGTKKAGFEIDPIS
jgi:hypothetical protein